ncbi:MAG TPA: apolipoprotein N-acyltransferase [Oligoflexia bacterium]|nr:apolipoprotein N-acyltransferase [Oligoflexia bacterium]HMP27784.1 apolipoprotein N-acyltransferase [Oligoflexia bacterium]
MPRIIQSKDILRIANSALCGLWLGVSWLYPINTTGAILSWIFAAHLIHIIQKQKTTYKELVIIGIVSQTIGFYWLYPTISTFSGLPTPIPLVVFALFALFATGQFAFTLWLYRAINNALPTVKSRAANEHNKASPFKNILSVTTAWLIAELIYFKIFPWKIGHTQIALPIFVQSADLLGPSLITVIIFWSTASLIELLKTPAKWRKLDHPRLLFASLLLSSILPCAVNLYYGKKQIAYYSRLAQEQKNSFIKINLAQANISLFEKHQEDSLILNIEKHIPLSQADADLYIWPETAITSWFPSSIRSRSESNAAIFDQILKKIELAKTQNKNQLQRDNFALIVGALSYEANERQKEQKESLHNSVFAVLNSEEILPPYHKKILMPFGEYMPLAKLFPFLKKLNRVVGDFSGGREQVIFNLEKISANLKLAPLICYEDVIPSMAEAATRKGATLLVNLTNDGWFGESLAPIQHHQIASFRAIENRRYLARATNTGLSGIVNPIGQTVKMAEQFRPASLEGEVLLLNNQTMFIKIGGESTIKIFSLLVGVLLIIKEISKLRSKKINNFS